MGLHQTQMERNDLMGRCLLRMNKTPATQKLLSLTHMTCAFHLLFCIVYLSELLYIASPLAPIN